MGITVPVSINLVTVVFNTDALTDSGHPSTTLRFTTKGYV